MTTKDKEIDVSGCEFYLENGECDIYYMQMCSNKSELNYGYLCTDNHCAYKQLAAKEQELDYIYEIYHRLDKENQQLKRERIEVAEIKEQSLKDTAAQYRQYVRTLEAIAKYTDGTADYRAIINAIQAKDSKIEQYKKSKQASYEVAQKLANEKELENRKLKQECEELSEHADESVDRLNKYITRSEAKFRHLQSQNQRMREGLEKILLQEALPCGEECDYDLDKDCCPDEEASGLDNIDCPIRIAKQALEG